MEPGIIALICAASFGVVTALAALIKQLLVSRDKRINDLALRRGLNQKMAGLEKIRSEKLRPKRFDLNYTVFKSIQNELRDLDRHIERRAHELDQLIERYAQAPNNESKIEMYKKSRHCEEMLADLRGRRIELCKRLANVEDKLLQAEQERNAHLDELSRQHSFILGQVYRRDLAFGERVATLGISAGTSTFKRVFVAPIEFLLNYFGISSGIILPQARAEEHHRAEVGDIEREYNQDRPPAPNPAAGEHQHSLRVVQ